MILALVATSAFAEPSFNQVQDLIGRQQYAAAEAGLVEIIKNHPNSAKAYYSMAQAQAGLGNLDKARYALDKATGLDPTLSFASGSQVQSLREALTPQVKKIEMVEETHYVRNTLLLIFMISAIWLIVAHVRRKNKEAEDDYDDKTHSFTPVTPVSPTPSPVRAEPIVKEVKPEVKKEEKKAPAPTPSYAYSAPVPTPQPVHTTTVVNQSNDGFLTGMLVGNMLSNHHDHVIEREVVREVPSRSYESSSSRSSSWDSDSSSSSWDSDSSSSSRSSSWDSDSSSSSSSWSSSDSSSSSWDSGSSSSSSDW
jgi:hypothetical protein